MKPKYQEQDNFQEDEDKVEIIDLDLPDTIDTDPPYLPAQRFVNWQGSVTRKGLRRFLTVSVVALVFLVVWTNVGGSMSAFVLLQNNLLTLFNRQPASGATMLQPSMVFLPQTDGFVCLVDAAWSPDSKDVALLGYQHVCGTGSASGNGSTADSDNGLVVVHDALTGRSIGQVRPIRAIAQALHAQLPDRQTAASIFYWPLLWFRDGVRLAILFSVQFLPPPPIDANPSFNGVFLFNTKTNQTQVLLQQGSFFSSVEWDLQQGKALTPRGVSFAGSYQWKNDGSFFPAGRSRHLNVPQQFAGGLMPVGNPIGSYSFSVWQPGIVALSTPMRVGGSSARGAPVYIWNTSFAAWSPDGRYLVANVHLVAVLDITGDPTPSHEELVDLNEDQLPLLRVRDMALQHLLKTLSAGSTNHRVDFLAWRPDGQLMAAYDPGVPGMNVFDTGTGDKLASLQLPTNADAPVFALPNFLRWSPDGSHLLLFDQQLGKMALWDMHMLR